MPKHPGGRPTEYSKAILTKAKAYVARCQDDYEERGSSEKSAFKLRVRIPTIEGLAKALGIHKDTIYEWEKIHPEFSDVLSDLRNEQGDRLINEGLAGNYNPVISRVLLTKHGYNEKQEVDHTTNGKDLTLQVVAFNQQPADEDSN